MIEGGENLEDYSPLEHLTKLKWLKIDSAGLKNVDFLARMPELTSLRISGSRITDLEPLKACGKLAFLALERNPDIIDYSAIGELCSLEELLLETAHGGTLPSLGGLPFLERLSLKGADDLTSLREATGVISLCLEDCPEPDLEFLSAMGQLTFLQVKGNAGRNDVWRLPDVLPDLTELALEGVTIEGRGEEIFSIPTLHALTLDDCRVHLDLERLSGSEMLEYLSMNRISMSCQTGEGEEKEIGMPEFDRFFGCFPNIKELYLESMQLEEIGFVEKLPHLRHLDIRGNRISSLKPLQKLAEIETVWYEKGTILFP